MSFSDTSSSQGRGFELGRDGQAFTQDRGAQAARPRAFLASSEEREQHRLLPQSHHTASAAGFPEAAGGRSQNFVGPGQIPIEQGRRDFGPTYPVPGRYAAQQESGEVSRLEVDSMYAAAARAPAQVPQRELDKWLPMSMTRFPMPPRSPPACPAPPAGFRFPSTSPPFHACPTSPIYSYQSENPTSTPADSLAPLYHGQQQQQQQQQPHMASYPPAPQQHHMPPWTPSDANQSTGLPMGDIFDMEPFTSPLGLLPGMQEDFPDSSAMPFVPASDLPMNTSSPFGDLSGGTRSESAASSPPDTQLHGPLAGSMGQQRAAEATSVSVRVFNPIPSSSESVSTTMFPGGSTTTGSSHRGHASSSPPHPFSPSRKRPRSSSPSTEPPSPCVNPGVKDHPCGVVPRATKSGKSSRRRRRPSPHQSVRSVRAVRPSVTIHWGSHMPLLRVCPDLSDATLIVKRAASETADPSLSRYFYLLQNGKETQLPHVSVRLGAAVVATPAQNSTHAEDTLAQLHQVTLTHVGDCLGGEFHRNERQVELVAAVPVNDPIGAEDGSGSPSRAAEGAAMEAPPSDTEYLLYTADDKPPAQRMSFVKALARFWETRESHRSNESRFRLRFTFRGRGFDEASASADPLEAVLKFRVVTRDRRLKQKQIEDFHGLVPSMDPDSIRELLHELFDKASKVTRSSVLKSLTGNRQGRRHSANGSHSSRSTPPLSEHSAGKSAQDSAAAAASTRHHSRQEFFALALGSKTVENVLNSALTALKGLRIRVLARKIFPDCTPPTVLFLLSVDCERHSEDAYFVLGEVERRLEELRERHNLVRLTFEFYAVSSSTRRLDALENGGGELPRKPLLALHSSRPPQLSLPKHMRSKCSYCSSTFTSQRTHIRHLMQTHVKRCRLCDMQFPINNRAASLSFHLASVHQLSADEIDAEFVAHDLRLSTDAQKRLLWEQLRKGSLALVQRVHSLLQESLSLVRADTPLSTDAPPLLPAVVCAEEEESAEEEPTPPATPFFDLSSPLADLGRTEDRFEAMDRAPPLSTASTRSHTTNEGDDLSGCESDDEESSVSASVSVGDDERCSATERRFPRRSRTRMASGVFDTASSWDAADTPLSPPSSVAHVDGTRERTAPDHGSGGALPADLRSGDGDSLAVVPAENAKLDNKSPQRSNEKRVLHFPPQREELKPWRFWYAPPKQPLGMSQSPLGMKSSPWELTCANRRWVEPSAEWMRKPGPVRAGMSVPLTGGRLVLRANLIAPALAEDPSVWLLLGVTWDKSTSDIQMDYFSGKFFTGLSMVGVGTDGWEAYVGRSKMSTELRAPITNRQEFYISLEANGRGSVVMDWADQRVVFTGLPMAPLYFVVHDSGNLRSLETIHFQGERWDAATVRWLDHCLRWLPERTTDIAHLITDLAGPCWGENDFPNSKEEDVSAPGTPAPVVHQGAAEFAESLSSPVPKIDISATCAPPIVV